MNSVGVNIYILMIVSVKSSQFVDFDIAYFVLIKSVLFLPLFKHDDLILKAWVRKLEIPEHTVLHDTVPYAI